MTFPKGMLRPAASIGVATVLLLTMIVFPLFFSGLVHAVPTQLLNRSIKLSDSGVSGGAITTGIGSGLAVDYAFKLDNQSAMQSLIVDFCFNDPLIGDTCDTANLTGFTAASATLDAAGALGTTNGWSLTASQYQLQLVGTTSQAAGTNRDFTIHLVTNPSVLGTFYARIYAYSDDDFGDTSSGNTDPYVDAQDPGNYNNYGGIALSTVNVIRITARVQEQLTFCVSGTDLTGLTCASETAPNLILGQGTPQVLDASRVDTAQAFTQLSTNALSGAVVRMRNSNACGGLSADFGTTCSIPANNSGNATPSAIVDGLTSGLAEFGLFVDNSAVNPPGPNPGNGTVTPAAPYHDGAHATFPTDVYYGMDTQTSNNNINSTYGSTVCSSTGPVSYVNNAFDFAATIANTTPAGIYTANMDIIATGTF